MSPRHGVAKPAGSLAGVSGLLSASCNVSCRICKSQGLRPAAAIAVTAAGRGAHTDSAQSRQRVDAIRTRFTRGLCRVVSAAGDRPGGTGVNSGLQAGREDPARQSCAITADGTADGTSAAILWPPSGYRRRACWRGRDRGRVLVRVLGCPLRGTGGPSTCGPGCPGHRQTLYPGSNSPGPTNDDIDDAIAVATRAHEAATTILDQDVLTARPRP
jgi:hypothetical protein